MKADASHEQRFIAAVDAFDFPQREPEAVLGRLNDWLAHLKADLEAHRLVCPGLRETGGLARDAEGVNGMMRAAVSAWSGQWAGLEVARGLADAFDAKAILLVFGKLNAGKSSFCNFLADRFTAQDKAVGYFHLDAGRVVETPEGFKEGATETTARLQGAYLGDKLVLLDTPGLHSGTPENGMLTRRFTDSADGVLWLTSSAAPGQVQELGELTRELDRAKPLLPVITRSDLYEEDEIDGELVKCLRNKAPQNRAQQEADVAARAGEKLTAMGVKVTQLKPPVSISVHMARAQGQSRAAMEEAGFERLYAALRAMAEPALSYKQRKPAEILLHHLEENVLGALRDQVLPSLAELKASAQSALDRLDRQREQMIEAVWRAVVPTLPDLLERHAATRDMKAVSSGLSRSLLAAIARAEDEHLSDYRLVQDEALAGIDLGEDAGFDDLVIEARGLREVVMLDFARLHAELENQIRIRLLRRADAAIETCRVSLSRLMERVAYMEDILEVYKDGLLKLKADIRL